MQNINTLKISPHYIGVPQFLIDTKAPMHKLFGEPPERPEWNRVPPVYKLGYQATVLGNGYCEIVRLNVVHGDVRPTDHNPIAQAEPVKYTTCETLDFWKEGTRDGWETLEGGELFTVKGPEVWYGFVHSSQVKTYLFLKGVDCTLIPVGGNTLGLKYSVVDYNDMFADYIGLFLLQMKKRPKNPCFTKRKRQIVFV